MRRRLLRGDGPTARHLALVDAEPCAPVRLCVDDGQDHELLLLVVATADEVPAATVAGHGLEVRLERGATVAGSDGELAGLATGRRPIRDGELVRARVVAGLAVPAELVEGPGTLTSGWGGCGERMEDEGGQTLEAMHLVSVCAWVVWKGDRRRRRLVCKWVSETEEC